MTLEELRKLAIFQNSIDVWIKACEERDSEWYSTENYKQFIGYLRHQGLKMQKFPLCVKETGGMYERGKNKTNFAEELSQETDENAAPYTLKLSDQAIKTIRQFSPNTNGRSN